MILVYESNPHGHCPSWWYLAASAFLGAGQRVVAAAERGHPHFRPWVAEIEALGGEIFDLGGWGENHWSEFRHLAERSGCRGVFFPTFDSIVPHIARSRKAAVTMDLKVGGIWLRPHLDGVLPGAAERLWLKLRRTAETKRRRRMARAIERNRAAVGALDGLATRFFVTTEDAHAEVSRWVPGGRVLRICDPWLSVSGISADVARERLGLPAGRTILLHAGTARADKGLGDACRALLRLPVAKRRRLFLLRAGQVGAQDQALMAEVEGLGDGGAIDRFMKIEELDLCYRAADAVLLPYRGQKESSGIFIHAAANSRPVIASNFGTIGDLTRRYRLGRLFAHADVEALADVLEDVADHGVPLVTEGMAEFAAANSPDRFRSTLVEEWLRV